MFGSINVGHFFDHFQTYLDSKPIAWDSSVVFHCLTWT